MNDTNRILQLVLNRIIPTPHEQQKLRDVADCIISLIDQTAHNSGLSDVNGILVGSAARDTWISGEHDLDIFIAFPEETPETDLKTVGLEIARKVAEEADRFEERYAEHPYIHAYFNEFKIDLVPSFRVSSAACIKSAVDRTPFHNQFILSRINGLENDVRLLKQFMKGAGVYGSDLKTGGFSGYLAELLIIHYGSFLAVLGAADNWKFGSIIDIIGHGTKLHDDALVVVDPTDPARNVAAALSLDRMAGFIDASREFLIRPGLAHFFPQPIAPVSNEDFKGILATRGTSIVALVFDRPDMVDDIVYPQLFMLHTSLRNLIERHAFSIFAGDVWAGKKKAAVVLEMLISHLPPVKKHHGPPIFSSQHASAFKEKYEQYAGYSPVYIENGRYTVDIPRQYTDVVDLIEHEIHSCKLGKHVGESIRSGFYVVKDSELLQINSENFMIFINLFIKFRRK